MGSEIARRAERAAAAVAGRMPRAVRRVFASTWRVTKRLFREARDDRVTGLAGEVAYFAVLSIFPGLLLVVSLLGWLDAFIGGDAASRVRDTVTGFMQRLLTDQASGAVDAVRNLFEHPRGGVLTFAAIAALWGASRGFFAVIRALNLAMDVEERRSWIRVRLLSLSLALGSVLAGAVLLAAFVLGPLLGKGQDIAEGLGVGGGFAFVWRWLRFPAAFAVLVAWTTTLLHFAPTKKTPWRNNIPGAAMVAALWIAVSLGFSVYLRLAGGTNVVFGVLGGALILLVWIYLMALALLLGGELNEVLVRERVMPEE